MKRYTVKEVARMAGVSVRTLHFYDEIGLLAPASHGENGYRYYGKEELLKLQQILFHRELGFPLERIREILTSPGFDRLEALRAHRAALAKDERRLRDLIVTIDKTIDSLERKTAMKEKDLYRGLDPKKQEAYERELVARYGDGARANIEESKRRMKGWSKDDHDRIGAKGDGVLRELVRELEAGAAPETPGVQAIIARHYAWVCHYWTPARESYIGLGRLYADHADFRKFYEPYHPALADFLAAAMKVYAEAKLD